MAFLLRAEGEVETDPGRIHRLELVVFEPRGSDRIRGKLTLRGIPAQSSPVAQPRWADDGLDFSGSLHGLGASRAITFSACVADGDNRSYFDLLVLDRVPVGDPDGTQLRGHFYRPPQAQRLAALFKRRQHMGPESLMHPTVLQAIDADIEGIRRAAGVVKLRVPHGAACLSTGWKGEIQSTRFDERRIDAGSAGRGFRAI